MYTNELATLAITVNIPAETIRGQIMLMAEEYKPLVKEALIEARKEILEDDDVKEQIKASMKEQIRKAVEGSMKKAVDSVTSNIMSLKYSEFRDLAAEILHEKDYFEDC